MDCMTNRRTAPTLENHGGADSAPEAASAANDDIRDAVRALNEAITRFSRAVGSASGDAFGTSKSAVAASLDQAARDLASASRAVSGVSGKQDGRRRRSEETRARLLEAGRAIFAAQGYDGASVSDIAQKAGYTKGAFYSSFPSKEALFLEIVDRLDTGMRGFPGAGSLFTTGGTDPHDWVVGIQALPADDVLLHLESWLYAMRHEDTRAKLSESWHRWVAGIALETARFEGRSEPTQEDFDTAFGVIAVGIFGRVSASASNEAGPMVERVSQRLISTPGEQQNSADD